VAQIASVKRLWWRLAAGTNRSSKVVCRPSAPSGPPAVTQLYSAPALGGVVNVAHYSIFGPFRNFVLSIIITGGDVFVSIITELA
jgi:hypothetical protein